MLVVLALAGVASAGNTVADALTEARKELLQKQVDEALLEVDAAQSRALIAPNPLPAPLLARIPYYRGLAHELEGDRESAMHAYRSALVIDDAFPWDPEILADDRAQTLFEALRREVRDRRTTDTQVPGKTGAAKLYVDGTRVTAGDRVLQGLHLAQIACPDGIMVGQWTDFRKKTKWLKMCPEKVDTSVMAAVEDEPEDGFGLLPTWEDPVTPDEPAQGDPGDSAIHRSGGTVPKKPKPKVEPPDPIKDDHSRKRGLPLALMGGGGAMLVTGTVLNFVWVNPQYNLIDDARNNLVTRTAADELTAGFNTARLTTLSLLGGGVALTGAGVALGGTSFLVVPNGVRVVGRF